jgi:starch synthase
VSTVSPTYAREIQTPEMGYGMDAVVRARASDLSGILNGVDYEEWDPQVDAHIARRYSLKSPAGKADCKTDLLRALGLPEFPDLPVVGVTSRLVWLKGFDIVATAWWDLLQRPLRMVILGTGDADIEAGLGALAARAPDRVAARFVYDTGLAHKIMAGSDILLMPSRFEPCGLTQLYALRYGTVPVVRSAGGLVDSVEPWDPEKGEGTGFRFSDPDGTGMMWAIDQALAAHADKKAWRRLVKNGMSRTFSWDQSARAYEDLYRKAMAKA